MLDSTLSRTVQDVGKMSARQGPRILVPAQSSDTQMKQQMKIDSRAGLRAASILTKPDGGQLGKVSMTGSKRRDRGWAAHRQITGLQG
jgi:hypothetical protein